MSNSNPDSTGDDAEAARAESSLAAPSAGRPRSEEAHQAILSATLELLVEVGFSSLTVEGVAQRAGVGKATIYRRWRSKLPLIIEAYGLLPQLEEVDTGNIVSDLEEMLRNYLELLTSTPLRGVIPSIAGERAHNEELSELFDPISRGRRRPLIAVLERGVARGELPSDLDLDLAADLLVGPITTRLFFGSKISTKMVGPMVKLSLWGLTGQPRDLG
ncbi:MAG: TetR/AcrR family transcriptional regulator [Myxococcota bacterium]|nr:TetR/AcrR family transcriptional regulator [Myxococcota bacterium]